jgi:hypothetical protein
MELLDINLSLHLTLDTNARHEQPTSGWDLHRPRIRVEEATYPISGDEWNSFVSVEWPGSFLQRSRWDSWFEHERASPGDFDVLRQLFFDPNPQPDKVESEMKQDQTLLDQKAKYPHHILDEITADNIDTYDLSKVNIYHLVPKGKQMSYFWNPIKSIRIQDRTFEEFFSLMFHCTDNELITQGMWDDNLQVSFDFDAAKTTKLVIRGKDYLNQKE